MTDEVREKQILEAKKLYSQGSRNFLVKCYSEAADELSQVCALYEEIYGELSDELGMPYLLYAKSLIALALEENKVIDVPEHENDDDDDDDEDSDKDDVGSTVPEDKPSESEKVEAEADTTDNKIVVKDKKQDSKIEPKEVPKADEETSSAVTSTAEENGKLADIPEEDNEKPSTSNGVEDGENDEEENEAASSLQLAWEILELAAKIFSRQGLSGLPNLAEVQTELANIEFENNIVDSAREDYEKALKIYQGLPDKYRRAMAEIYYKIGLTYLMQQMNQEGAESLKEACALIEDEISEIKAKDDLTDKDTENVKDMEETKQEIWAKIAEIEETRQQNIAEVRAALDNVIGTPKKRSSDEAGPSSSAVADSSILSSKPTDISHLIKRKKADTNGSEAEEAAPPTKKPAV